MTEDSDHSAAKPHLTSLFVDAVTDGSAQLLWGEVVIVVPAALLPPGAREGDWVELSARVVPPPVTDTEERRRRLVADDPGGPLKL